MPVVLFDVLVWNAKRFVTVELVKSAKKRLAVPVFVVLPLTVGVVNVGDEIDGDVARTMLPDPVTFCPRAV